MYSEMILCTANNPKFAIFSLYAINTLRYTPRIFNRGLNSFCVFKYADRMKIHSKNAEYAERNFHFKQCRGLKETVFIKILKGVIHILASNEHSVYIL
jgi:hypothetical protein